MRTWFMLVGTVKYMSASTLRNGMACRVLAAFTVGPPRAAYLVVPAGMMFLFRHGCRLSSDASDNLYPLQSLDSPYTLDAARRASTRAVGAVTGSTSVRRLARAIVAAHGGAEAVVAKGGFGATPPPGEKPAYIGA